MNTQMTGHTDMADIDIAVKLVERYNNQDLTASGHLELTAINQHGMLTASGLNDYDYENICNLSLGHKELQQVQTVYKIPIPSVVLEHFRSSLCTIEMGLFPEIGRAWLTIDSELYIWTYEPARDIAFYDGLNQSIMGVGLVKPKPNVFVKEVQYLLILATTLEIAVLGVTFGCSTKILSSPALNAHKGQDTAVFEELQLVDRPIFILGTDEINFRVIEGTDDGRIFLGGHDGCLYELVYPADSGWFGKPCKKVNYSKGIISSYMLPQFINVFGDPDPIVQISIDNSRRLLYILTERGCIEAWLIGEKSKDVRRIARVTKDDIAKRACSIISTVDISVFKEIKSLCVLTSEDSNQLHLIAVTHCGVRFYFSTTAFYANTYQRLQPQLQQQPDVISAADQSKFQSPQSPKDTQKETPQGLYLLHIRLPPGYTTHIGVPKPKLVHTALYSEGTILLVSTTVQRDQGNLLSLSANPFPNRSFLTESATLLPLDGLVWSMAPMREHNQSNLKSIINQSRNPVKVMLLTHQGIHVIALMKPADILKQLLLACHGPHHEAVKCFFQVQTPREACYTCLLIICGETFRNSDVSMWAAQALLLYGGEPSYQHQIPSATSPKSSYINPQLQTPISIRNFLNSPMMQSDQNSPHNPPMTMSTPYQNNPNTQFGRTIGVSSPLSGNLTQQQQQSNIGLYSPISNQTIPIGSPQMHSLIFSAKHDALYLYVARLLRPIWNMPCIHNDLSSAITNADCANILDELHAVKNFLDVNAINELSLASTTLHPHQSLMMPHGLSTLHTANVTNNNISSQQDQRRAAEQAHNEEKRSLVGLVHFIKHTCEVLGFWKILCEHEIISIIKKLREEQQNTLKTCTFHDLIISSDTCAVLIVTLINSYLDDNASVGSISAKLRDVCPSLYRHEDAVSYKATELLRNSMNCNTIEEKQEQFLTALQLCKDAAPNLPLQHICQQFILVGFYEGVIELSVACASKSDPEQYGIHYYNKDEPSDDRDGYAGYAARMLCYKEVRLMLDHIYQESGTINKTNLTMQNNSYTTNSIAMKSDPKTQVMKIVALGIQANDPLLHITLYEWLLSHEMLSELLEITEPSLGDFLRRNVVRNPDNLQIVDLLWKYYEKNDQHAQAAQILDNLASTKSVSIPLEQRIEHLARAVMCMRNNSLGYSVSNGILLKELEDKLEIARVQKCILDAMTTLASSNPNVTTTIKELNYMLYDITQLYQNFADPFNLWECKLTILNCSNHNDQLLIESVWSQIINKAVEAPGTPFERCNRLFTKMESLIRQFGESGHCFPLAFLIRELEVKACHLKFPEGIVPEKLIAMNLDIELLMEYYTRMISMNQRVWANEGNEWHLVQSAICLVTLLTNNVQTIWHRSKRRVFCKAQDIISACLNLCYPKPGTEEMQQTLKNLQCRVQRAIS